MARIIDYVSVTVILTLVTFVWSAVAFGNWIVALIFSVAFTAAAVITVWYVKSKKNKPYTYDRLAIEFAMRGNEYVINTIKNALKSDSFECGSNYILLENAVFITAYRFNLLSVNDICSACATANKLERKTVFLLAKGIDRRAYQIVQMQSVKLKIIKMKAVFNFLYRHGALPDLKPVKNKPSLKALVEIIFNRANAKSYIFSGVVLIGVAFLTPLKIYYLTLGSVSLLLALLTFTPLGNGLFSSPKVFAEFEKAMERTKNDNTVIVLDAPTDDGNTDGDGIKKRADDENSTHKE